MTESVGLVRPMTADDLDAVLAVERSSYEFPWTPGIFRDCLRAGYLCVVAEEEQKIRGFGLMSFGAGECHILNLCVAPDGRRDGVASSMLDFLLTEARRVNASRAFLELRVTNVAAANLYRRFGFEIVGRRDNYYPHREGREDALVLALPLLTR